MTIVMAHVVSENSAVLANRPAGERREEQLEMDCFYHRSGSGAPRTESWTAQRVERKALRFAE